MTSKPTRAHIAAAATASVSAAVSLSRSAAAKPELTVFTPPYTAFASLILTQPSTCQPITVDLSSDVHVLTALKTFYNAYETSNPPKVPSHSESNRNQIMIEVIARNYTKSLKHIITTASTFTNIALELSKSKRDQSAAIALIKANATADEWLKLTALPSVSATDRSNERSNPLFCAIASGQYKTAHALSCGDAETCANVLAKATAEQVSRLAHAALNTGHVPFIKALFSALPQPRYAPVPSNPTAAHTASVTPAAEISFDSDAFVFLKPLVTNSGAPATASEAFLSICTDPSVKSAAVNLFLLTFEDQLLSELTDDANVTAKHNVARAIITSAAQSCGAERSVTVTLYSKLLQKLPKKTAAACFGDVRAFFDVAKTGTLLYSVIYGDIDLITLALSHLNKITTSRTLISALMHAHTTMPENLNIAAAHAPYILDVFDLLLETGFETTIDAMCSDDEIRSDVEHSAPVVQPRTAASLPPLAVALFRISVLPRQSNDVFDTIAALGRLVVSMADPQRLNSNGGTVYGVGDFVVTRDAASVAVSDKATDGSCTRCFALPTFEFMCDKQCSALATPMDSSIAFVLRRRFAPIDSDECNEDTKKTLPSVRSAIEALISAKLPGCIAAMMPLYLLHGGKGLYQGSAIGRMFGYTANFSQHGSYNYTIKFTSNIERNAIQAPDGLNAACLAAVELDSRKFYRSFCGNDQYRFLGNYGSPDEFVSQSLFHGNVPIFRFLMASGVNIFSPLSYYTSNMSNTGNCSEDPYTIALHKIVSSTSTAHSDSAAEMISAVFHAMSDFKQTSICAEYLRSLRRVFQSMEQPKSQSGQVAKLVTLDTVWSTAQANKTCMWALKRMLQLGANAGTQSQPDYFTSPVFDTYDDKDKRDLKKAFEEGATQRYLLNNSCTQCGCVRELFKP